MFLTRQNAKGGKKVMKFQIVEEESRLGYKIGYCGHCNETILIPLQDRDWIVANFHYEDKTLEKLRQILTPKISFRQQMRDWLIRKLSGAVASSQLAVDNY